MSSRRWYLSAALIAALASTPAAADELGAMMKCSYIAALSYADQEAESANSIASAALRACQPQFDRAVVEQLRKAKRQRISIGAERIETVIRSTTQETLHDFVIDMRNQAKLRGPNFYKEAAVRLAQQH